MSTLPQWLDPSHRTLRVDFDNERRKRLETLNRTIDTVTRTVTAYVDAGDTQGIKDSVELLGILFRDLRYVVLNGEGEEDDQPF